VAFLCTSTLRCLILTIIYLYLDYICCKKNYEPVATHEHSTINRKNCTMFRSDEKHG
jgi:hypothetical protein